MSAEVNSWVKLSAGVVNIDVRARAIIEGALNENDWPISVVDIGPKIDQEDLPIIGSQFRLFIGYSQITRKASMYTVALLHKLTYPYFYAPLMNCPGIY